VYLDADERTNRILMIGLEEQLAVVDELIDTLDVEQKDLRTLRLYEIQFVDAEEVRNKLSELGIISGGGITSTSGRTATRTTTRTTPTRPATPTRPGTPAAPASSAAAIEEPLTEEPQVVIIEPTNSLLVNATAEQHVQIAMIIGYVDNSQEETANPYVIYPLENQDPEELSGVLEKLISETITEQQGAADSKVVRTTTRKKIEEDIFIVPDPKTYSLIVYASKKNQQWISSLIEELDQYRPQVLLDCTLVEVTRDDEFAYDLDIISQIVPGADTMQYLSGGSLLPEFSRSTIGEAINTGAGLGNFPGAGGQGFLAKGQVQVLFKIMEYRGYGRVLARPKLLVNDNEEGTITTEDTIYVAEKQTKYIPSTSAPGTTPGYSPDTSVTFKPYNAGIELTIQPHISKGDQLQLTITLNRTDFDLAGEKTVNIGGEDFPKPLDTRTSNVQTIVTVPDGKTIILGGLEKTTQSKGGGKVPILGDLPFIGGLFRNASNASVQSRLYVFVKAHILRPGQEFTGVSDIEVVSLKNRATFERFEKEMQDYEDWPGIKPKPMDPEKVLEEDEDRVVIPRSRQALKKQATKTQEFRNGQSAKGQPIELNQNIERNGMISLNNRQLLDESKKDMKEGRDLPGTKSKLIHPMRILEDD
jgi:general secretion pathway protein D